jgi:hypothetical protein
MEKFTANNSPQGQFIAGKFTAEAIHRKDISRRGHSPQSKFTANNSPQRQFTAEAIHRRAIHCKK